MSAAAIDGQLTIDDALQAPVDLSPIPRLGETGEFADFFVHLLRVNGWAIAEPVRVSGGRLSAAAEKGEHRATVEAGCLVELSLELFKEAGALEGRARACQW